MCSEKILFNPIDSIALQQAPEIEAESPMYDRGIRVEWLWSQITTQAAESESP